MVSKAQTCAYFGNVGHACLACCHHCFCGAKACSPFSGCDVDVLCCCNPRKHTCFVYFFVHLGKRVVACSIAFNFYMDNLCVNMHSVWSKFVDFALRGSAFATYGYFVVHLDVP